MCGIIAVVRRPSCRSTPTANDILSQLRPAIEALGDPSGADLLGQVVAAGSGFTEADRLLRGVPGVRALLDSPVLATTVDQIVSVADERILAIETHLDAHRADSHLVEDLNREVLALRDSVWAIGRDRLRTAREVATLAGASPSTAAVEAFTSVQVALSAIDRLEVRGRDSAGVHLMVRGHGLDLTSPELALAIAERSQDPLFVDGAVRVADGMLSFVYKAAAEIGELGDNTAALRAAITADGLLRRSLEAPTAEMTLLGHTRWASVGIISEPNAHPVNSDQVPAVDGAYVVAALNGDVDNHVDLRAAESMDIDFGVTTDAKVIPVSFAGHLDSGMAPEDAWRTTASSLEGSVAIAASSSAVSTELQLALRGSGQALYVGLAEDMFVVASEPYGVVEETPLFLRMDGETPANAANPTASRGQLISLESDQAGEVSGIRRQAYDGTLLPVTAGELVTAEITTRDIDRGEYPHFLLKEITEAPQSFRKTLRGKLLGADGDRRVELGESTLPTAVRDRLASGQITKVLVTGQGTAAIAGRSLAAALSEEVAESCLYVKALPATELSGFELQSDMSDTLVVAISQSGTTTDTNRTVDLIRARGGVVIAIVNRRNSDLTDKADGVLYTSDGRDVEMSVASTKAFYSQIAAGLLLATAIADATPQNRVDPAARQRMLKAMAELPQAMEKVLTTRDEIGRVAREAAPSRRYWAIVGNGRNLIAAEEVRIKLSELCYKSIACDATEDKKHIDLSSEPLILVCAAGLVGSTADDVAKEVAIYRAHKATPIVVSSNPGRFAAALHNIEVPEIDSSVAFVLATMVGHLFGYEAARAIDDQAQPLRESRAAIEAVIASDSGQPSHKMLALVRPQLQDPGRRFIEGLRRGDYNGHLEASTAARITSLYGYALRVTPLDSFQLEWGKVGTPAALLEDLDAALGAGIDELTRPIDAIKHQAKTVTVGISRSDETLLELPLVRKLLATGTPRDQLSYRDLRTLADINPAVVEVVGYMRYRIEGDIDDSSSRLVVIDRGGLSQGVASRVDSDPSLRGTKHRVSVEQQLLVTRGRGDGRTIIIVPEVKDRVTIGLTLLHVSFPEFLPGPVMRGVLQGYRNRYLTLRDLVTETEPTFRDELLGEIPVADLLIASVQALADRWKQ